MMDGPIARTPPTQHIKNGKKKKKDTQPSESAAFNTAITVFKRQETENMP
jgi:hypothetical protein